MTHTELVEAAGRCWCIAVGIDPDEQSPAHSALKMWQQRTDVGMKFLSALRAQGVALVPREATEEMAAAYHKRYRGFSAQDTPEILPYRDWSAMLAAGEIRPEEGEA